MIIKNWALLNNVPFHWIYDPSVTICYCLLVRDATLQCALRQGDGLVATTLDKEIRMSMDAIKMGDNGDILGSYWDIDNQKICWCV